jgi:hypothetical protein
MEGADAIAENDLPSYSDAVLLVAGGGTYAPAVIRRGAKLKQQYERLAATLSCCNRRTFCFRQLMTGVATTLTLGLERLPRCVFDSSSFGKVHPTPLRWWTIGFFVFSIPSPPPNALHFVRQKLHALPLQLGLVWQITLPSSLPPSNRGRLIRFARRRAWHRRCRSTAGAEWWSGLCRRTRRHRGRRVCAR